MCDGWTTWIALFSLLCAAAEFGLRLSSLQPRLRRCPWPEWPGLLWRTMLDDRIYLLGWPRRYRPRADTSDGS